MTQFNPNTPMRRAGGGIDVYTGLLLASVLVLLAGVLLLSRMNLEHSAVDGQGGGLVTLIE